MTPDARDVADAIGFFKGAFTIVMALALGESFKQFVAERAVNEGDRTIQWDRLPALISFLFLIVPFYQGMSRYFYITYSDINKMPQPYSVFLMFDGTNFMTESALFFVMSRALAAAQWRRYYGCVLVLLIVDSVWVGISKWLHSSPIQPWMFLNIGFAVVVIITLSLLRAPQSRPASLLLMAAVILRTILDYAMLWTIYFP